MLEKIIASVAEQLAIDPAKVTKDSNLIDDLKADSLDIAALMLDLEEQYGIEIPDEELANLRTVGDIAAYLEARQ
ncbi:MAG: acyl carrier protein [Oscillospiraceae bacterium]|nr:MAG: acyl carrier protein [Oscillospiraceae bacterium]